MASLFKKKTVDGEGAAVPGPCRGPGHGGAGTEQGGLGPRVPAELELGGSPSTGPRIPSGGAGR